MNKNDKQFIPYYKVYTYSAGGLKTAFGDAKKYKFETLDAAKVEVSRQSRRFGKNQIVYVYCTANFESKIVEFSS